MKPLWQDPTKLKLLESTARGTVSEDQLKRIPAIFYRTEAGSEPVRSWLRAMDPQDRRLVGEDIKTVEFGWPVGMPTCRPLGEGLYEVRTPLLGNRIVRVFFYIDRKQRMVLLHGIVKKTRSTPDADLDLARKNMRKHEKGLK
ncbi:MAG: type II toxin-antitoxin system RelE/ParE family toxin [Terracidiphilus sp.]